MGDALRLKISTSEVSDFKACRELHRIRWVHRIVPRSYDYAGLRQGIAMHDALDAFRATGLVSEAFAVLAEADVDPYERARMEAMVAGHEARWAGESLYFYEVEKRFQLARDTYVLHGKLDGLARDHEGRLCIVETKTTSQDLTDGSPYWATLTIDDQIGAYLAGAKALGYGQPEYVLYDVLKKPSVEPKRATPPEKRKYRKDGELYANQRTEDEPVDEYRERVVEKMLDKPDHYYARRELVRLEDEMTAHRRDLLRIVDEMATTYADPETPAPKSPHACKRFGRICEFVDVCAGRDSLDSHNFKKEKEDDDEEQTATGPQGAEEERLVDGADGRGGRRKDHVRPDDASAYLPFG